MFSMLKDDLSLTLEASRKYVADNILKYLFIFFFEKMSFDISCRYENTPIQIYSKISPPKTESFQLKTLIFFIFLLKT